MFGAFLKRKIKMYENRYLDADGVAIIWQEVRNYVKRNSNGGLSSIRFRYEDVIDFPEASLSFEEKSPGHFKMVLNGINIIENELGHLSINSNLLKLKDNGLGNISISI